MPGDDLNDAAIVAILKSSERALRESVATHGAQHPESLAKLDEYIELLRLSGDSKQLAQLEETARALKAQAAAREATTDGPKSSADVEPERVVGERHLYNSKGKHIATESDGHLFTPTGRHVAHWDEALEVFVDRNGWYVGHILDETRLADYKHWSFRSKNFGDRGNIGDRPGWEYRKDTDKTVLPLGYEDVDVDSRLTIHWRPRDIAEAEGF